MALSRFQQLISKIVPRSWASSMEAESRAWIVGCPACCFERSIWDLGGIRWKATGSKRILARCPNCGKVAWQNVYYQEPGEPTGASPHPPAPLSHCGEERGDC
jgi:hypothetical protein